MTSAATTIDSRAEAPAAQAAAALVEGGIEETRGRRPGRPGAPRQWRPSPRSGASDPPPRTRAGAARMVFCTATRSRCFDLLPGAGPPPARPPPGMIRRWESQNSHNTLDLTQLDPQWSGAVRAVVIVDRAQRNPRGDSSTSTARLAAFVLTDPGRGSIRPNARGRRGVAMGYRPLRRRGLALTAWAGGACTTVSDPVAHFRRRRPWPARSWRTSRFEKVCSRPGLSCARA